MTGTTGSDPEDPTPLNDGDDDGAPRSVGSGISDVLKDAITRGVRRFVKSEENIRNLASDIWNAQGVTEKVGEKVGAVGHAVQAVREEVVAAVGREFLRYLERMNLTDEVVKVLTALSLEVRTEIRFIPNDKKLVKPEVKADARVKRSSR